MNGPQRTQHRLATADNDPILKTAEKSCPEPVQKPTAQFHRHSSATKQHHQPDPKDGAHMHWLSTHCAVLKERTTPTRVLTLTALPRICSGARANFRTPDNSEVFRPRLSSEGLLSTSSRSNLRSGSGGLEECRVVFLRRTPQQRNGTLQPRVRGRKRGSGHDIQDIQHPLEGCLPDPIVYGKSATTATFGGRGLFRELPSTIVQQAAAPATNPCPGLVDSR